MIEVFYPTIVAQSVNYFSTKRTFIPTFTVGASIPDTDFCVCELQCIPCLIFLTDEVGTIDTKNDFFSLFQNSITGGSHKVFIYVDGVEGSDDGDNYGTEITNNDYGTLYNGTNWYAYEFTAFKIHQQIGYKEFYCALVNYDSTGTEVARTISACRKLVKYSDRSAHGTITIESRKNGILRHGNNYSNLDLVSGKNIGQLRNQIRLHGSFIFSGNPIEETHVVLNNKEQSSHQVFEKGSLEYEMKIFLASETQVMPVLLDDLFANEVYVTDFNVFNFNNKYIPVKVRRVGGAEFTPSSRSLRKSFTQKMVDANNNIEKFND